MSTLIVHTEGGGKLAKDCPETYVRGIAREMAAAPRVVMHFHGGLVSEKQAREMAERLDSYYRGSGLLPVFFVWETAIWETIPNNLRRIAQEPIFKTLVLKILRHVAGKVMENSVGGRGISGTFVVREAIEVQTELEKKDKGTEPYGHLDMQARTVSEINQAEQERFEEELNHDADLEQVVADILAGQGMAAPAGTRSVGAPVHPQATLMSAVVVNELQKDGMKPGSRGLFSTMALVKHAANVLIRVVQRFVKKRDHGIYTTVVEELLRELYVDTLGTAIWGSMKKDAEGNLASGGGCMVLIREYAKAVVERQQGGLSQPKLSVVGHSAGTIFACHILKHVAAEHAGLRLHHVVFLAAACRCDLFGEVLVLHETSPLWTDFRAFALSDDLEKGYWEVPGVYPRSLLYLVSGLCEGGYKDVDTPLVGMQRYIDWTNVYDEATIKMVREFLAKVKGRQVWAPAAGVAGLNADAVKHGGFDETSGEAVKTMASVLEYLA